MRKDAEERALLRTDWSRLTVVDTVHERNQSFEGMTVEEIARLQNKHPLDAFLDLALDEGLETEFQHPVDPAPIDENIANPFGHISVSDGGAHTRYLTTSTWPVEFLAHWVRDKEIVSLEQAHYKISTLPAWFADFKDRGMLRVGAWADIMVYDQLDFFMTSWCMSMIFRGVNDGSYRNRPGFATPWLTVALPLRGMIAPRVSRASCFAVTTWWAELKNSLFEFGHTTPLGRIS